jgi:GH15 family glucan-1,4-alpha-glucosidase
MRAYKKLKDYGIIGNLDTCALVNNEGVVEWCCFPHVESPSVFASILDTNNGGYFMLQPAESFSSTQRYLENSNVLQTEFVTASGTGVLIDFMPVKTVEKNKNGHQAIYRQITCEQGQMNFRVEFAPRFDYARSKTRLTPLQGGLEAVGKNSTEHVFLQVPSPLEIKRNIGKGGFPTKQGEKIWFVLRHNTAVHEEPAQCKKVLDRTLDYWQKWVRASTELDKVIVQSPLHDLAVRSSLILKLLMNHDEGSIAAAATTSIPEDIGGVRNWDYRYNWVRDASFTIQAFYHLGHAEEARKHLNWFTKICKQHGDPADIQPLYGMYGKTKFPEEELYGLEGYRGSRPVRIGNRAYGQKQLDVYGELINAFYETTRYGKELTQDDWLFVEKVVNHVCKFWNTEDSGIWEMRNKPKHFVYSKVMCWVALDRGIKIAKLKGVKGPLKLWRITKKEIESAVLEKGFNKKLNSFVQSFDSEELDASTLLIPIMGFLSFDDSRVQGTIDAILEHLTTKDMLVNRYKAEDGLHGEEGAFLLCSFWLVKALALSGRIKEAENILTNMVKFVSPTGLLSEEVDRDSGELLGNFPQAFSHIGLINSIIYLNKAKGKKHKGPSLLGDQDSG